MLSKGWLNLLEDFQLYGLVTTRYTGPDSGITCLGGSVFHATSGTAIVSGVSAGGTISAQNEIIKVLLWLSCRLEGWEREPPQLVSALIAGINEKRMVY